MNTNIFRTTLQVTVLASIEKTLSFFYRIYLTRMIGAEGIGIYQICLSVFAVFLTLTSSGIPMTVSRLMTKYNALGQERAKHAVVTAGVLCTFAVTIPSALILLLGRNALGFLFGDSRSQAIFLILIPGLILTSVYAVMRGTFWGNKDFLSYSLIELAEDSVMVILGCLLVMGQKSPVQGATLAIWAVLASYIFSFITSVGWYFIKGGKIVAPRGQFKPLLSSAIPITAMRTATSLLNTLVAIVMPILLVKGLGITRSQAVAEYGVTLGMAIPILFIPTSLIGSIAVVQAPELSGHYYRKQKKLVQEDIEKSLKATIFIATILIPLLFTAGRNVGMILFADERSGSMISRFAWMLLPMCLSMISTTLLNSLNREKRSLLYFFIGSGIMLTCLFGLTWLWGTYAYLVGLALNFCVIAVCNLTELHRLTSFHIKTYLGKCVGMITLACLFGWLINGILQNLPIVVQALLQIALPFAFTIGFLFSFGIVNWSTLKNLYKRKATTNTQPKQKHPQRLTQKNGRQKATQ